MASVGSCKKLPLCSTEPMPAGSKTDLPLAKVKPIGNGGRASGITYLIREKNPCVMAFLQQERGVRICERKQLCRC